MINLSENNIEIRRLHETDLDALFTFYKQHHSHRDRLLDKDKFQWEFLNNPFSKDKIPFFILLDNNRIQGTIGALVFPFTNKGNIISAAHLVNFFINPDYKGLFALRLFRTIINEYDLVFGSYVSDDAYKLCKSARFIDHSQDLYNYYLAIPNKYSNSETTQSIKSTTIKYIRSILLLVTSLIVKPMSALNKYRFEIKTLFDLNFISLISINNRRFGIAKNTELLLWRYGQCPTLEPVYFQLYKSTTPCLCLIAHYDKDSNALAIMDIIGNDAKSSDVIYVILQSILYCKKNNIGKIINTSTNKKLGSILKRLSFGSTVSDFRFLSFTRDAAIKEQSKIIDNWEFILGDTDVY